MSPVQPERPLSPPSEPCGKPRQFGAPPQYHRCYNNLGHTSYYDPFNQPNPWDQPGAPDPDSGVYRSSYGFSYGFVLWRYLLDWGDRVGVVVMKQGLVTALKGWPLDEDRAAAAACLFRYVRKGDECQPNLTLYLIRHPAFVGFTWDATALKTWLAAVEPDPQCITQAQYPDGSAGDLATEWLDRARRYWVLLTSEPFPYDLVNMVGYWRDRELGAPPLPADQFAASELGGQASGYGACGDCGLA